MKKRIKKGKSKRKVEKDMKEKKKGGDELDLNFNIVDYFGFVVKT